MQTNILPIIDTLFQLVTKLDKSENGMYLFAGFGIIVLIFFLSYFKKFSRSSTVYGSAHFARKREIKPLITRWWEKKNRLHIGSLLTIFPARIGLTDKQQESHVLIVAPSGKGKTACIIIPGLLQEDGHRSLFINDMKRELISKCLGALQAVGYNCYILAPTRPEESHRYNPLRHITSMEDAESLADCIVSNTGSSEEPFWNNAAKLLLTATILHIQVADPTAPLSVLTDILCGRTLQATMETILKSPSKLARNVATSFLSSLPDNPKLAGSIIADMSSRLMGLQNPDVAAVTADDEFDFNAFIEKPTAFILSIPASDTERLTWLSAAFSMQLMNYTTKKAQTYHNGRLPRPLAFYLDELSNMGVIPHFLEHISLVRSAGIAFICAIQNFAQVKRRYSNEGLETLQANTATHVVFSGCGQNEVEFYSRRIGNHTRRSHSKSYNAGSSTTTESDANRALITPDEFRTMKPKHLIVLSESFLPMKVTSRPYFKQHRLMKRVGLPLSLPFRPTVQRVVISEVEENVDEALASQTAQKLDPVSEFILE